MELVDQKTSDRHDNRRGVDYGRPGKVLVERGELTLVWQPGGTHWSGMYGNLYTPASLDIRGSPRDRTEFSIHEGGRLSAAVIAGCAETIDRHFGEGVSSQVNVRKTLVVPA